MGDVSLNGASGKPGGFPEYVALHWHRELCQCGPFISPILVETEWTLLKRTQTRSWYNSRLVKAKISKGDFEIKAFHCLFRREKLAAGISKIGLQAKRISGAQRKKLVRERNMKEGTWMVEKPKRKTLPSQDKGRAGSSGGVKRPHSYSSTPSQEKQQPKKPRSTQVQTGTYNEAVVGIKMAIVALS
jgi:hypothetical protein